MPAPALAGCELIELTRLPVTMSALKPLVSVRINGAEALFLLDSGAFYSFISPAAAAQFQLKRYPAPFSLNVRGVGGEVDVEATTVQDFVLADLKIRHVEFLVGGNDLGEGAAGLVGQNILGAADVEYDLAKGIIRLMHPGDGCRNVDLAYWAKSTPYSVLDIDYTNPASPHTKARAEINGVRVDVLFDTGANSSMLATRAARRAGIKTDSPGVVPSGSATGMGRRTVDTWVAPIASFKIGGEEIKNTRLEIGELYRLDTEMLIGADFFLAHRVYVSNRQHKLYFTYNGGPVFDLSRGPQAAAQPQEAAEEPVDAAGYERRGAAFAARRDFEHAFADLTRACELEPGEAKHFYRRALAHLGAGQRAEAIADLDEAVRLEPGNPEALMKRAQVHMGSGDKVAAIADLDAADRIAPKQDAGRLRIADAYVDAGRLDQAIAQYDLWIGARDQDVRLAVALNGRCWARALLGTELEKALADCNAAFRLRRDSPDILDSRGLVRLRLGEFEQSIADYDAALKQKPDIAWSLYGRGLAKLKKGMSAEGRSDIAAATAAQPTIAEEAAQYGLAP
jgi:tetratricopeptide (TPR) repeat protein/predicted aspartyl protease